MPEKLDPQLVLQSISDLREAIREMAVAQSKAFAEFSNKQEKALAEMRAEFQAEHRVSQAELRTSHAEFLASQRELQTSQAEFLTSQKQIRTSQAEFLTSQRELLASLAELRALQAKNEAQFARTDAQLARTDAKLERIGKQLADIGFSNGDAAEDWFYSSLQDGMRLGSVRFDTIERNVHKKKKRLEDEYDILMTNGDCVALVEVKYKVSIGHIEILSSRKIENFRQLFPDYADYKVYVAIAGMSYEPQAEDLAHEQGVVVLKQHGDHLEVNAEGMRAF